MKAVMRLVLVVLVAVSMAFAAAGCGPTISGKTADDTTVTGTSKELGKSTSDVEEYQGPKLRVGVVNFQNKTPSKVLGIGEAAADILGTILQKTGRFIVIPQQDMESLAQQQHLGASGMINPETAPQMGQVLGLNAIVTGAVTAYSETEEGSTFVIGKSKTQVAKVTVDYRIVDTTTGVQILADSGAGIYKKSSGTTLGFGSKAAYDSDLRDGALRDALTKAMVNMMKQLQKRKWSGRVAAVNGRQIYVNAGQKSGIKVEDELMVYRPGEAIIDPVTKMKLGTTETFIGKIKILQNDLGDSGDMSVAQPVGAGQYKAGDIVKLSGK
ncbi:MAG: hypothetical protein M0042_11790 [Nitrospiraceae bacterium]|nr:hypothetical protein [Nitrospiraceae bacterium]